MEPNVKFAKPELVLPKDCSDLLIVFRPRPDEIRKVVYGVATSYLLDDPAKSKPFVSIDLSGLSRRLHFAIARPGDPLTPHSYRSLDYVTSSFNLDQIDDVIGVLPFIDGNPNPLLSAIYASYYVWGSNVPQLSTVSRRCFFECLLYKKYLKGALTCWSDSNILIYEGVISKSEKFGGKIIYGLSDMIDFGGVEIAKKVWDMFWNKITARVAPLDGLSWGMRIDCLTDPVNRFVVSFEYETLNGDRTSITIGVPEAFGVWCAVLGAFLRVVKPKLRTDFLNPYPTMSWTRIGLKLPSVPSKLP